MSQIKIPADYHGKLVNSVKPAYANVLNVEVFRDERDPPVKCVRFS